MNWDDINTQQFLERNKQTNQINEGFNNQNMKMYYIKYQQNNINNNFNGNTGMN